jgi:glycosyltransferase involved in cell wall biosynthesis
MNQQNPTISAVIVARNEEANLAGCLETLLWCDEIILVDMESEDRTVEVARKFTDRIHSHQRVPAFDIAKKYAVEQATCDWILLIDADEMVSPQLAQTLRSRSLETDVDVVEIPFRHYIMGACAEYTGWGFTPLPRFFRKEFILFTGIVHDYMHLVEGARVTRLADSKENCIEHFAYRDSSHFVEKLNRYTTIEAMHLYDGKLPFSIPRLLLAAFREFVRRYFFGKGYREGMRGFSLSLMMAFYRALTFIKLWENYRYENETQDQIYKKMRKDIIDSWCSRNSLD